MKKIAISLVLIINVFVATAQKTPAPEAPDIPMDTATKLITYTDVIEAPGVNAQELFKRAKIWIYGFYKSPSTVIQKLDSTNDVFEGRSTVIMIKTLKDGTKSNNAFINYSITINMKDGKYRYKITNFNMKDASYHPIEKFFTEKDIPTQTWDYEMMTQTDTYVQDLIQKLKNGMAKPSNAAKSDNW